MFLFWFFFNFFLNEKMWLFVLKVSIDWINTKVAYKLPPASCPSFRTFYPMFVGVRRYVWCMCECEFLVRSEGDDLCSSWTGVYKFVGVNRNDDGLRVSEPVVFGKCPSEAERAGAAGTRVADFCSDGPGRISWRTGTNRSMHPLLTHTHWNTSTHTQA